MLSCALCHAVTPLAPRFDAFDTDMPCQYFLRFDAFCRPRRHFRHAALACRRRYATLPLAAAHYATLLFVTMILLRHAAYAAVYMSFDAFATLFVMLILILPFDVCRR